MQLLLEREKPLAALGEHLDAAARGRGGVVLVGGEAGIGKTSLARGFAASRPDTRTLWGFCDPLVTPHPLGPVVDIIAALGQSDGHHRSADAQRNATFAWLLDSLSEVPGTVAVIEDLHWADDATLDLVRYLGRRIHAHPMLLVLTYRDDEVGGTHPLRSVLGDLATLPWVHRMMLQRLGIEAVRELADGSGQDVEKLHLRTGGNPFFVTEVLATADSTELPQTVRDAVLARAARLSDKARAALEVVAVVGQRAQAGFLSSLLGAEALAVDECLDVGILAATGAHVMFRHELARQAILEAIPPARRAALHRMVLDALRASDGTASVTAGFTANFAVLAEHADNAGDDAAVLEFAPLAGREAAAASAHRQAASHFALALTRGSRLPPPERAKLLEEYALESSIIGHMAEGIDAMLEAIAIWRQLEQPLRESDGHSRLVTMYFNLGRAEEAEESSRLAIGLAQPHGRSRELARAYRSQAVLRMLCRDTADAVAWGQRAIELAEYLDDKETLGATLNAIGSAWITNGDNRGEEALLRSRDLAMASGQEGHVSNAYGNLGSGLGEVWEHRKADEYLAVGIAYALDRDLDSQRHYMLAWRALTQLHLGHLDEVGTLAEEALRPASVGTITKIMALLALGRLRARRGDPGAWPALDEALRLADETQTLQRIAPVRAARAEAAWLDGNPDVAGEEAAAAYPLALAKQHPAFTGELAYWLRKVGREVPVPEWVAPQFGRQAQGDWRGAAEVWERLGCPYERYLALSEGDDDARIQALVGFTDLGTEPAADLTRRDLRARGVRGVPRGPRAATSENAWGLTAREVQVLDLLAEGLTNAQISNRLTLSTRTVEHHVSAVLNKLGATTRGEAAAVVRRGESSR